MCICMCNLGIFVVVAFGHSCLLRFRRICIDIMVAVSIIWYLQYECICACGLCASACVIFAM